MADREPILQVETLLQKWQVTEWRDGAVFKTELVGEEWRPLGSLSVTTLEGTTYVYSPMPTDYTGQTIRRIKPNTNDTQDGATGG